MQVLALRPVLAVGVDVLSQKRHLDDSVSHQRLDLVDDLAQRAALLAPACGGDDTEGAVVVASGLDGIPAGLPIGTIRSVDAERTTLFQIIRIDPAHEAESVWRVLVLVP